MESNKMTFKEMRKRKGLTQQALADKAGVSINQIQRLEYNESNPENIMLKTAVSIADALGVDAKDLLR